MIRRIVYQFSIGDISSDQIVSTTCHNHRCVKQSHLKKMSLEEFDSYLRNNAATGDRHGTHTKPETRRIGESNGFAKLTESQVREIREIYVSGNVSYSDLADRYGVYHGHIAKIIRGDVWSHVNGVPESLPKMMGERNGRAKLTAHDVNAIRTLFADGATKNLTEIARRFHIGRTQVRRIIDGTAWAHIE